MNSAPLKLKPAAQELVAALHRQLRTRWEALDAPNQPAPATPPDYRAAALPNDLKSRRVELIVEASDLKALDAALNSDADALVLDFDDTFTPTRANVETAYAAVETAANSDKPILARPRALYAVEEHLDFGGPAIAALCDLGVILAARPETPMHIYIPKLETEQEAQLWEDALALAETHLGLEKNAIKVCVQIETYTACLHADALLYALHGRAFGLNAGRWDYVFSLTKRVGAQRGAMPPRNDLTMDLDAMRAYAEALVRVCEARGAQAIGGSAAVAPNAQNPQPTLDAVRADKVREAAQGYVAAWAGLPMLLDSVRGAFGNETSQPLPAETAERTLERLLDLPAPCPLPLNVVQDSIGLALAVFEAWYHGRGVVVRNGRIEDTATAELARAQLWQWVKCEAELEGGDKLTADRYLSERRALADDDTAQVRLLDHLVLAPICPEYFPHAAQLLQPQEATV
ncbi:aldolase/citrate lyase family protein [Deinococcus sp. AJ005]|uniref:aldolase/citrate lyase family protein n=1 Tax=Deinococcus sp. AJ005 TaxID=2652443 RepID=UPI00125CD2EE|nr:aldolase/citrate lyase family protein [Deinococcus sp. AJ005]QFP78095.1 malate synthase A [Deinococcus sp. AJ005]